MRLAAAFALLAGPVAADTILSATFTEPTTRYSHGVLGDAVEWGSLEVEVGVRVEGGLFTGFRSLTYGFTLPDRLVYEDLEPRLWDVNGDGAPEVVVVLTDRDQGASLVIIGLEDDKPVVIASTPHIGQSNRWLAPVGAADLDGDGAVEIAFVDRPHLARTLRVWRLRDDSFTEVAAIEGLTNHRIGDDFIQSGLRDCGAGPQFVMASADWSRVMAVALEDGRLTTSDLGAYVDRSSIDAALGC